jgi:hypothetical protein
MVISEPPRKPFVNIRRPWLLIFASVTEWDATWRVAASHSPTWLASVEQLPWGSIENARVMHGEDDQVVAYASLR